jgi:methylmalonyl-CoA mutase
MDLTETFEIPSLDQWISQLRKDLTEEDFKKLSFENDIEELKMVSYGHSDNAQKACSVPGSFPYTRGSKRDNNNWHIGHSIYVSDENEANKKALEILMKGTDLLLFYISKNDINLSVLLKDIGLEYIRTEFHVESIQQWHAVFSYFSEEVPQSVSILIDPLLLSQSERLDISNSLRKKQFRTFQINGKRVLEAGSSSTTEVGFCLSAGHSMLFELLDIGFSVDEAAACLHFSMGIGNDYFTEISKFRAFRTLWSNVIKAYSPLHNCSYHCEITAYTISLNKSLIDPYTNLLRQTTEGMSAVAGGAQNLVIEPYDSHSVDGSCDFSERMALNISLMLKEESYMDAVIDPMGGSYTVETLTYNFCEKAWELFRLLEENGGMFNEDSLKTLKSKVNKTRNLRIQKFVRGESTLIGINKYPNPEPKSGSLNTFPDYLGLAPLILEQEASKSL